MLSCPLIKVNGNYTILIHSGLLMAMNLRSETLGHPITKRTITRERACESKKMWDG